MSLSALDEDTLRLIATKALSADHTKAQNTNHWAIRVKMPSLCLRETNRTFRWLTPMKEVRVRVFEQVAWLRTLYINNTVMSLLDAIADDMAQGFLQMHTLEKDGIFFHVQMHSEVGMLFQAHEIIAQHNGSTKRNGMMTTMELPQACMVDRRKRTPQQQEEVVKWCEENKMDMLKTFGSIFVNLHEEMCARSMRMFEDME